MFLKCRTAGMDMAGLGKALAARRDEPMRDADEEVVDKLY
jgi:hypothetical protein